ncbi:MAG: RDD family protein [Kiritimatiellae bacterium]|nr:RDD family protein [Kiritimatiellia bacterium]
MPYCNNCGFEYSVGPATCPQCGAELPHIAPPADRPLVEERKNVRVRRFCAGLIDLAIAMLMFGALFFSRRLMILVLLRRGLALMVPHVYLLVKDAFEGKSIGKLLLGLVTYNEKEKKAAGLLDSIIRNWYLAIPFLGPTLLAVVVGAQILSGKQKRMGDQAAETIVISDFEYQKIR